MMEKIQVEIRDKHSKLLLETTDEGKNPIAVAGKYARKYPDGFVTVTWQEGKSMHYQMAENMVKDQEAVGDGEMSINRFVNKWYPGKKLTVKDLKPELDEEFGEDEEETI